MVKNEMASMIVYLVRFQKTTIIYDSYPMTNNPSSKIGLILNKLFVEMMNIFEINKNKVFEKIIDLF